MRNAKVTAAITAAVAAVLAVLGKAFNFGVDTTTQILMRFGYDWGRAAARAPFYRVVDVHLIEFHDSNLLLKVQPKYLAAKSFLLIT